VLAERPGLLKEFLRHSYVWKAKGLWFDMDVCVGHGVVTGDNYLPAGGSVKSVGVFDFL